MKRLYYDPTSGFMSLDKFVRKLKEDGQDVKRKDVKDFLQRQLTYQLNKQQALPGQYSTYWVHNVRDEYQIDLMVYDRYEFHQYKYVLCLIDIKSRYANARPLTNKRMDTYRAAITDMCNEMGWPKSVSGDQEFNKPGFLELFPEGTRFRFSFPNELHKNPIVERWHRTLAGRMQKWRTSGPGRRNWPDVLRKIVEGYNHSYHATIKARPVDVWNGVDHNKQAIREVGVRFHVGDRVRIRLDKGPLDKGDRILFSEKVYIIHAIEGKLYVLMDEDGDVQRRKRKEYEIARVNEIEQADAPSNEPIVRPRRAVRSDVDATNVREGRRERRAPVRLDL